jgi:hypothetical protein
MDEVFGVVMVVASVLALTGVVGPPWRAVPGSAIIGSLVLALLTWVSVEIRARFRV